MKARNKAKNNFEIQVHKKTEPLKFKSPITYCSSLTALNASN